MGYVVFDVGAYSADAYEQVLWSTPQMNVTLTTRVATATVTVATTGA